MTKCQLVECRKVEGNSTQKRLPGKMTSKQRPE